MLHLCTTLRFSATTALHCAPAVYRHTRLGVYVYQKIVIKWFLATAPGPLTGETTLPTDTIICLATGKFFYFVYYLFCLSGSCLFCHG